MAKVIGIDLGTTNSLWRTWRAASPRSSRTPKVDESRVRRRVQ